MSSNFVLSKFLSKLTQNRWVSFLLGSIAMCFSSLAIWFIFLLKEFSSNTRDNLEAEPGILQTVLFGAFVAGLVAILILGFYLLVKSIWRRGSVA